MSSPTVKSVVPNASGNASVTGTGGLDHPTPGRTGIRARSGEPGHGRNVCNRKTASRRNNEEPIKRSAPPNRREGRDKRPAGVPLGKGKGRECGTLAPYARSQQGRAPREKASNQGFHPKEDPIPPWNRVVNRRSDRAKLLILIQQLNLRIIQLEREAMRLPSGQFQSAPILLARNGWSTPASSFQASPKLSRNDKSERKREVRDSNCEVKQNVLPPQPDAQASGESTAPQPTKTPSPAGSRKSNRGDPTTPSSRRSRKSSYGGSCETSAPFVGAKTATEPPSDHSSYHRDISCTSAASTVSGVSRCMSDLTSEEKPSSKEHSRKPPKNAGRSYQWTKESGPMDANLDPIYGAEVKEIPRGRVKKSIRKWNKTTKVLPTEVELHFYLVLEFAFVPRDCTVMRQMTNKAKSYLNTFDTSNYTAEERFRLVMKAVRSAMCVTEEEECVRAALKNPDVQELAHKQAAFIQEGFVGNEGIGSVKSYLSNACKINVFKKGTHLPKKVK